MTREEIREEFEDFLHRIVGKGATLKEISEIYDEIRNKHTLEAFEEIATLFEKQKALEEHCERVLEVKRELNE